MDESRQALRILGANIRRKRTLRGLSQEQLASHAGLDRSYVGSVERGERNVTLVSVLKFSKGLGVSLAELLDGVDDL